MLLYAVTDRSWLGNKSLYEQVKDAIDGGITILQLREKMLDKESFIKEAIEIGKLCKESGVIFIINDDVDVAIASDADGVHIGQDDGDVREVRAKLGDDKIIGVSSHNVEEALKAQAEGADYLGAGAVFGSTTKTDAGNLKKETLKAICEAVDIPVVAIGGINKSNILELKGTGIAGTALVSAVFAAKDIKNECIELKQIVREVVE